MKSDELALRQRALERAILSIRRRLQARASPAARYALIGATAIRASCRPWASTRSPRRGRWSRRPRYPTEENARAAKRPFLWLAKHHRSDQGRQPPGLPAGQGRLHHAAAKAQTS